MRNAIQRFFYGRYGNDQLNKALVGAYFVLFLLSVITHIELLDIIGTVALFLALFRMLSSNTSPRREENAKFLKKAHPAIKWLRMQQTIRKDKDHRYFKCPNCSQYLRVPRGKGKITVTCRSCRASFQEKS